MNKTRLKNDLYKLLRWMVPVVLLTMPPAMVYGQQRPQYTQYIFNNYLLNPAISGIENYTDVKFGSRLQWSGLKDAPETSFFSVHLPLGKDYLYSNPMSFPEKGNDPMARNLVHYYRSAAPHHGVGLYGVFDRTGPLSSMELKGSYAYHLGLGPKLNLSLGIAAGVTRFSLDVNRLVLENELDPVVSGDYSGKLQPDLGAGLWLYGAQYFVGVSAQQLLGGRLGFSDANEVKGRQVPHVFVTGGYKLLLGDDLSLVPSVMLKYVSPAPLSTDLNLKLAFRERFWVGTSYRSNDAVSAMAGFNLGSLLVLSYAYDYSTSELRTVSSGSHELVLGILLNNRYRVRCPQRNW